MKKIYLLAALAVLSCSCGKWLDDIAPKHAISTDKVGDEDIDKLTNGVLYSMESYAESFWYDGDRMGEVLRNGPGGAALVDVLLMTPSTPDVLDRWQKSMTTLRQVNELIGASEGKSGAAAENALKTAYFCRAYIYFNMYIRWGTAPVMQESTMEEVPLSDAATVLAFVIEDLNEALKHQSSDDGFFYVNDAAINAMLAKAYLWQGNTSEAARCASAVIGDTSFSLAGTSESLASTWVYGTSSPEIVFALANRRTEDMLIVYQKFNDTDASWNYSMADGLRSTLYADVPGVKTGDIRKPVVQNDDDPNRVLKFPNGGSGLNQFVGNENASQSPLVLIRLAEMYLTKAEAQGNTPEGLATLEEFMDSRYGSVTLPSAMTDTEWEDLLLDEYLREFFGEGHRWFDVKRMGRTDKFSTLDGRTYLMLWPVPQHEIDLLTDKSLYPQNPGYAVTPQ